MYLYADLVGKATVASEPSSLGLARLDRGVSPSPSFLLPQAPRHLECGLTNHNKWVSVTPATFSVRVLSPENPVPRTLPTSCLHIQLSGRERTARLTILCQWFAVDSPLSELACHPVLLNVTTQAQIKD